MDKILLNKQQAAEKCNCSKRTIERWIKQNFLKPIKVGNKFLRIDEKELDDFLKKMKGP